MNKTELIGCVAEKSGLAKKDARKSGKCCIGCSGRNPESGRKGTAGLALATSKCVNALRARAINPLDQTADGFPGSPRCRLSKRAKP